MPELTLPVGPRDLVFVCRMCVRMAEQVEKGATSCQLKCGGPKRGLTFPLYTGPLTNGWLRANCYQCGKPAQQQIRVTVMPNVENPLGQEGRILGVCLNCVKSIQPLSEKSPC